MPDSCLHEVASFLAMRIGEQALAYPHRPRCRGYDAGRVWTHLSAKKYTIRGTRCKGPGQILGPGKTLPGRTPVNRPSSASSPIDNLQEEAETHTVIR